MSDLPPPGSGTPPPPPPPGGPDEPGEGADGVEDHEAPADEAAPEVAPGEGDAVGGGADATPVAGTDAFAGVEDDSTFDDPFPTTVMAAGAVGGAAAVDPYAEVPGSYPTGTPLDDEAPLPWYKQRGPLIAAIAAGVVALLVAVGLGLWLFGSDDEGANIRNRVVITLVDETGATVQRELVGRVNGSEPFQDSFVWLRPANAIAPDDAVAPRSEDDVEFMWAATDDVTNQATWLSEFTLTETIPKGWRAPSGPVQCILEREGRGDSSVEMSVAVKPRNINRRSQVTYRFPDHVFEPGDTVRCTLVSTRPVPETATTTSSTTTTVPETTTTTTSTTTTTTPAPEETAWDVIRATAGLEDFATAVEVCGLDGQLSDPNATLTVFAPNNDVVPELTECVDPTDTLLKVHIHPGAMLSAAELDAAAPGQLEMLDGLIVAVKPGPIVGGADITDPDIASSNATIHIVDALVSPGP